MRVRPVPGLHVSVDADGRLDVITDPEASARRYRCGPVGTAMWIALCQHDGDVQRAADALATMWATEPVNARADLDIWVDEMRDAGLVRTEP